VTWHSREWSRTGNVANGISVQSERWGTGHRNKGDRLCADLHQYPHTAVFAAPVVVTTRKEKGGEEKEEGTVAHNEIKGTKNDVTTHVRILVLRITPASISARAQARCIG